MNPNHFSSLAVVVAVALLAVEPVPGVQDPSGLTGGWLRDDSRGDGSYLTGEYPGMTLEIDANADRVVVRQSLGRVRDGVAQPGSGSETLEYTLVLDGEARQIPAPGRARRTAAALWDGAAMNVESVIGINTDAANPMRISIRERWTVTDAGATLRIERTIDFPERGVRTSTVVFGRMGS